MCDDVLIDHYRTAAESHPVYFHVIILQLVESLSRLAILYIVALLQYVQLQTLCACIPRCACLCLCVPLKVLACMLELVFIA